jgi:signal transduction protein with GAF and PtsI domain
VVKPGEKDLLMPEAVSLVSAPIQGRRRVYGVVTVGSKTPGAWNEEDGKTVMAIATGLAVIIEQKAQVSGDVVLQLRRARQLEQMLTKLRKPMARLLYLQQRLQDETHLLPIQQELMAEVEGLYTEVAKTIWAPKDPPSFNDSPISPPPKPAGSLSAKTRTS